MKKITTLLIANFGAAMLSVAQTNPAAQSLPYSQNFSTLAHSATAYPAGWQGWTIATAPGSTFNTAAPIADRVLTASSGASVNSGNVHNYDGKIGCLNTGSLDLGLVLAINTTGKSNVKVIYDIMTVRNPYDTTTNSRINDVTLQYRIGTSGAFTNLPAISYQNNTITQTGAGVTTPQNPTTQNIVLPSACDNQSVVQLRWASRQVSGSGARPSFAVDNVLVDTVGAATVAISSASNALEGGSPTPGNFNIVFNPATTASATFDYQITGTATFGTDYTIMLNGSAAPATLTSATGTITVPSGSGTITVAVTPINDAISEGAETVVFKLTSVSTGYVVTDSIATMSINDDEATLIHTIQGSGATATPGSFTVEAIVTGVYPTLSPAGFYIQEENSDADANVNTSEGIFVVSSETVAVGDKVRVSGTVLESSASPSFQQAVISNTTVSLLSSNNPLPYFSDITLPLTAVSDFEKYEGMMVQFPDTLTVTDNYNLGRYGEIYLSKGGMLYTPTQFIDPNDAVAGGTTSAGVSNVAAVNAFRSNDSLRTILLDDGRGTIPTLPYVNTDNTLRLGSKVIPLRGIMGYAFSAYRVQPLVDSPPIFVYAQRPAVPSVGAGATIKVASFNVLNYFNGDGIGGGYPTARGAHSAVEFSRQRAKIISALVAINADVVGLIEIENDGTGANSAIQDLVNGLNAQMGTGTYSIVNDGATIQQYGTDAIRCGIIYKSSKVTVVNAAMLSSNSVFNRPPLAQTFKTVAGNQHFNFIINHFKSKGCTGSSGADADLLDGQSCYNNTRKQQATELLNFINSTVIPTSGTARVLSVGDYNAYYEEDPLDILRAGGYTILGDSSKFSYLYFGQVGSLDNAAVSDSLKGRITGIAKWNINSPEPPYLDYNDAINDGSGDFVNQWASAYTATPFRSSDHDPILIGLNLSAPTHINSVAGGSLNIYPNPATDELVISGTKGDYQVTDIAGRPVLSGNATKAVDVSHLPSGFYIMNITDNGETTRIKFAKQ